ncbi:hypothetical protein JHK85_023803 [Glycine max]|nr:hypothetical protein JHK85_023803 [Glycine max]
MGAPTVPNKDNFSHIVSSSTTLTSWVSKGVRDLPGNFQSATSNVPSGKALVYFGLFLASGVFFVFIAFTLFLPVMVVMPQKFALCFTLGCGFIIGSFFALKGPKSQLAHMLSKERLPFTLAFLGSMIGTIYVSMVLHSYILSVVFSVVQVLSLGYYSISYFPGGSAGMKFLTSAFTSSIMKCFGRLMSESSNKFIYGSTYHPMLCPMGTAITIIEVITLMSH